MPAIQGCIWRFAADANRDERPETVFCDANFSSFRTEAALQAVASPARAAFEQALHEIEAGVADGCRCSGSGRPHRIPCGDRADALRCGADWGVPRIAGIPRTIACVVRATSSRGQSFRAGGSAG